MVLGLDLRAVELGALAVELTGGLGRDVHEAAASKPKPQAAQGMAGTARVFRGAKPEWGRPKSRIAARNAWNQPRGVPGHGERLTRGWRLSFGQAQTRAQGRSR